jgi:hypothetical protein
LIVPDSVEPDEPDPVVLVLDELLPEHPVSANAAIARAAMAATAIHFLSFT